MAQPSLVSLVFPEQCSHAAVREQALYFTTNGKVQANAFQHLEKKTLSLQCARHSKGTFLG